MKKNFVFLFVVAMTLSSVHAEVVLPSIYTEAHTHATCVKVTEEEIAALFDRWNAALATLDAEKVAMQYARDAILLPTMSNYPRTNHSGIQDYFVHFLEMKPQGKVDYRVISIGCNIASDTGLYTFTLHDKKGKTKQISGRYSFVYEYADDQWLIEHHHSSMMPEKFKHSKK